MPEQDKEARGEDARRADRPAGLASASALVMAAAPGALALYALALAIALIAQNGALLADWYSIARHDVAAALPSAMLRVLALTTVAMASVMALGLALLPRMVGILSATLVEAYNPLLRWMSISAALLGVILAAIVLDQPALGRIALVVLPAASLALALRSFSRRRPADWDHLLSQLFTFAQLFVSRLRTQDQTPTFEDEVRQPTSTGDKVISFLVPAALALSTLIPLSVLIEFGAGLAAVAIASGSELAPVWTTFRVLFLLVVLVPALPIGRALLANAVRTQGTLLRLQLFVAALLFAGAIAAIALYTAFAAPAVGSRLVGGAGYVVLLALFANTLFVFAMPRWRGVVALLTRIRYGLRARKFWIDNYKILRHFPQPASPKGYVFFHSLTDTYTIASLLLVLCRLRQLGWATVIVDQWPIPHQRTGSKHLDRFFAARLGSQRTLNFDWAIDWDAGKVEAAGMNFYHPIWEGLSRHFGRYRIKLSDRYDVMLREKQNAVVVEKHTNVEQIFREILTTADSTLLTCFRVLNTVAGQGKPVRILGGSGQFVPNAVWNIFCRELGRERDMHFVWVQQGYQTYYKDKARLSDRISLENMTRKWPYSNPYLPHKADFEAWMARGQNVPAILEEAGRWTRTMRATSLASMGPAARQAYERIRAHHEAGQAVVCVLGKMVFDLSTPWERGPAHSGMSDWINHTVEIAARNPDVLYVVKPHPYESRPEIAGVVEQFFTDMIERPVSGNVLILGHDWFNLYTLFPHIDLGVMWNGTSGLELGLNDIPCVACSDWGPIDYPVGFPAPTSRSDYERMLADPRTVTVPAQFKERCALLLKYTASEEVMIPYAYCARPITNEPFGPPYWHMDEVRRFIREGDPHIDFACTKIL